MYHARYEKPLKNHSLFVAKKNVDAVALDLEEEVPSKNKTRKKKRTHQEKTD